MIGIKFRGALIATASVDEYNPDPDPQDPGSQDPGSQDPGSQDPNPPGLSFQVAQVAAGYNHSLVLMSDGRVKAWGDNRYGQLGNNNPGFTMSATPGFVVGPDGSGYLEDIVAVAAGSDFSLALRSNGTVWAWGSNESGQLGIGIYYGDSYVPVQVKGPNEEGYLTDIIAIAAGDYHALALQSDGTVWAWGSDNMGQLGYGGETGYSWYTPVK